MPEDAPQPPSDASKPAGTYDLAPGSAPVPTPPAVEQRVVVVREEAPMSRPGFLTWQVFLTVGVTTLITASILAAVEASRAPRAEAGAWAPRGLVAALQTLAIGPLSALLGVLALWIAGRTLSRPLGDKRLAFARMLAAVGVVALIATLGPLVIGVALVEWAIAAAVYILVVWASFRLPRNGALLVAALHLALCGLGAGLFWAAPRILGAGDRAADPPPAAASPEPGALAP
ncbi:MAG: hypothetical protein IBJ10_08890 [Phycisphaerales bacterium]|nr:hypothetical protein [Phycisphaerales bacterium]